MGPGMLIPLISNVLTVSLPLRLAQAAPQIHRKTEGVWVFVKDDPQHLQNYFLSLAFLEEWTPLGFWMKERER